jgi:hypothetical protein
MNQYRAPLMDILREVCPSERFAWLERAEQDIRGAADTAEELATLSAIARRKMSDVPLPQNLAPLLTPAGEVELARWTAADAARTVLILAAAGVAPDGGRSAIEFLFRHGDETERAVVVRGLALYDDGTALKQLILEAGRANSLQLISAASLGNPYPAAHYSDREFNQMVLKNLFVGLSIDGVTGLEARANPELSRMCEDYYDERTAAGREVPADIWLAMGPYAGARAEGLITEHLSHDSPEHRCYACIATGRRLQQRPQLRWLLTQMKTTEADPRVLKALETALAV